MKTMFTRIQVNAARIRCRFARIASRLGAPLRACLWLGNRLVNASMRVAICTFAAVIMLAVLDRLIGSPVATEWANSITFAPLQMLVEGAMETIPALVDEIGEFVRHLSNRLGLSTANPLTYASEGYVNLPDLASRIA